MDGLMEHILSELKEIKDILSEDRHLHDVNPKARLLMIR